MKIHVVRDGDTLIELAQKYNVPVERLLESNSSIKDGETLDVGSKVRIPTGKISLHRQTEAMHVKRETPEKKDVQEIQETQEINEMKAEQETVEQEESTVESTVHENKEISAPYFSGYPGGEYMPMPSYPWPNSHYPSYYSNVAPAPSYDMNFNHQPSYYSNMVSQKSFFPPTPSYVYSSCCQPPGYGAPYSYPPNYFMDQTYFPPQG